MENEVSPALQTFTCLSINSAMTYGFQLLLAQESTGGKHFYVYVPEQQVIPITWFVREFVCGLLYNYWEVSNKSLFFLGAQWGDFFSSPSTETSRFAFGHVVLMLVLDSIIYMLIALYLEQVLPGPFGTPKRWNFLFTKDFWCISRNKYGGKSNFLPL